MMNVLCCRVILCLMDSIDKPEMTDECKNSLMEVFYFVSRDFKYVEVYIWCVYVLVYLLYLFHSSLHQIYNSVCLMLYISSDSHDIVMVTICFSHFIILLLLFFVLHDLVAFKCVDVAGWHQKEHLDCRSPVSITESVTTSSACSYWTRQTRFSVTSLTVWNSACPAVRGCLPSAIMLTYLLAETRWSLLTLKKYLKSLLFTRVFCSWHKVLTVPLHPGTAWHCRYQL